MNPRLLACVAASSALVVSGCDVERHPDCTTDPSLTCRPQRVEGSQCGAETQGHADEGASHVADGTVVSYGSNPPSSGPHYSAWADFRVYETPVPRGNWVHSMEHGAVVVLYSCDDCSDEVALAGAWLDTLPLDSACVALGGTRRAIVTPDPLLDVRWAAAAWGQTLKSDCFEPDVFGAFYDEHYAQGREDLCSPGLDLVE